MNILFSSHEPKNMERKQKVGNAKKYVIWMGNFTLSPVSYVTVNFKKVVSDQKFHAGSPFVESKCMKKMRLLE